MSAKEFNLAMAELDKLMIYEHKGKIFMNDGISMDEYSPYNNLNQLMPLAWKHNVDIRRLSSGEWLVYSCLDTSKDAVNKDPIESIRQCLIQIKDNKK